MEGILTALVTPTKGQLPDVGEDEGGTRSGVHTEDTEDTESISRKNHGKIYVHKETKKKKKIVTKKNKYQMGGSTSGNSNIKPEKEYEIEEGGRDE